MALDGGVYFWLTKMNKNTMKKRKRERYISQLVTNTHYEMPRFYLLMALTLDIRNHLLFQVKLELS